MNKEEFINELKKLNIDITEDQLQALDTYYMLLVTENKKYNLTAITEEKDVYLKHFYDSLTIVKAINLKDKYICDIGTGAGFPGIVLKIIIPSIKIDLIDATTKKCQFLTMVIEKLKLKNINVINARIEEYSKINREKYDIIVSRAVAPLKHLLEYSIPLLKVEGTFIALKANLEKEMLSIDNYYQKLRLQDEKIISFTLPNEAGYRTIYSIRKKDITPSIYPRKYNQIKKCDI